MQYSKLLFPILVCLISCKYSVAKSDQEIIAELNENSISSYQINYDSVQGRTVRVVVEDLTEDDSTLIIFVHGAPGKWSSFKQYLKDSTLLSNARLLAYDRPGYGASGKTAMTSIVDQSNVLLDIIRKYRLPKVILVGHSYGGPVVGVSAMLEPELVSLSMMISPLNDPDNEPIFWLSYFAKWKATKWFLPQSVVTAGAEKFSHADSLDEVRHLWPNIRKKIVHIHGDLDILAPAEENISFSKANIPAAFLDLRVVENENHVIHFLRSRLIRDMIIQELHQLQ